MTNYDQAREIVLLTALDVTIYPDLIDRIAYAIGAAEERGAKWMQEAAVARRLEIRCAEDVRTLLDPAAVCAERRNEP